MDQKLEKIADYILSLLLANSDSNDTKNTKEAA